MAKAWVGGGGDGRSAAAGAALPSAKRSPVEKSFQAGEGDRVALFGAARLGRRRAHEPREAADALLDAVGIDDRRAVGEAAAQHPRQRQLAAVRRVDGADDLRQRRPLVVDAEARAGVGDGRRLVPDGLQQPGHTVAFGRRAHQHRHDMALAQFTRQIVEHQVLRRVDVADELLHQRVVVIGELFQHRIARLLLLGHDSGRHFDDGRGRGFSVDEGAFEREIDETGRDPVFPYRDLAQQERRARRRLKHLQRLAQAPARQVDLVEEKNARHAELLELAQDDLQSRNLAGVGFADHDGGVGDRQRVAHVVDELDRARAVEEGEPVAHVVDAGDIRLDAHGVAACLRTRIAHAGALAHRPLPSQASAAREDSLE